MSKAIARSRDLFAETRQFQLEAAQSVIVLACGAALILAGQALPL
jgi:hypothetical protein